MAGIPDLFNLLTELNKNEQQDQKNYRLGIKRARAVADGRLAIDKISGSAHSLEMTRSFGMTPAVYRLLGIVELTSVILFMFPRTGVLGLLLLSSYLGGAIATHLQHGQSFVFPVAIEAFIWIAALIRFPQLRETNMDSKNYDF
jgi:hypothetical protein